MGLFLKDTASKKTQEKQAETEIQKHLFGIFCRNLKYTCISEMRIENRSMIKRNMKDFKTRAIVKKLDTVKSKELMHTQCLYFAAKMFTDDED
jgi:hypothetical protein